MTKRFRTPSSGPWIISRALTILSVFACVPAYAADPTTSECLSASDASLKAGSDHLLRAEQKQLLVCAANSCPGEIRRECTRRVEEVNAAIPTLVFEAKDAAGNDLSEVKVTMDGEVLAERLDGTAIPVDPGEHTFVFETAGQSPVTKQLVAREAEKDRHETIQLGTPPNVGPQPPPAATASSGHSTQKTIAVVVGGVGVAGLAVGGTFGMIALSKKNDAQKICPNECADEQGARAWSDAKSAGNVSTIAFIAGGALLAGAAVLWFTAGPSGAAAEVGLGLGHVQLKGSF